MPRNHRLIDTHAHVFTNTLPMAKGRRYTPTEDATPSQYLAVLDEHDVSHGMLVQPSFLGTDNSYVLAVTAARPDRFSAVAVVDHEHPEIEPILVPGVKGIRLNLVGRVALPDLTSVPWLRAARELTRSGLHLEVHADEQQWASLAEDLANWPSEVVIDHLGLPASTDPGIVTTLSQLDHVWVKVSGPYRSTPALATRRATAILEATDGERMVFGSDWPFTQHADTQTYRAQVDWARRAVGDRMFDEVLPQNAQRLFKIGPRSPLTSSPRPER